MTLIVQQLVNGVMVGCVYVMVAVAFTLTIGILNFLNFHDPDPVHDRRDGRVGDDVDGLCVQPADAAALAAGASCVGIVVAILVSLVIERFTFRYMKTKYGDATEHAIPLVSSLGFVLILQNLVQIAVGRRHASLHRADGQSRREVRRHFPAPVEYRRARRSSRSWCSG